MGRAYAAAAERRGRVGAAGAWKDPGGVLPGDRWPHEILPSGPWKVPGGVLPGDRWVDLDPCERTPQTPAAPAWPSGLTRRFGIDVRKSRVQTPGPRSRHEPRSAVLGGQPEVDCGKFLSKLAAAGVFVILPPAVVRVKVGGSRYFVILWPAVVRVEV